MVLGRHQHEIVSASVRMRGSAFWQVLIFLMEALVFILIGLTLREVVTLAIALSLPETMPGRDLILVASFAVVLVAVPGQGTTIGPLIKWVNPDHTSGRNAQHLTEPQAWARLEAAQFVAIQPLVHGPNDEVIHPRLLEQYSYRARITETHQDDASFPGEARAAHYGVILAAVSAGRTELLKMHRAGLIHDELLTALEHDLDLQEIAALHGRGQRPAGAA
jgi:CPA1 family monovalent cation:H+ antiporter